MKAHIQAPTPLQDMQKIFFALFAIILFDAPLKGHPGLSDKDLPHIQQVATLLGANAQQLRDRQETDKWLQKNVFIERDSQYLYKKKFPNGVIDEKLQGTHKDITVLLKQLKFWTAQPIESQKKYDNILLLGSSAPVMLEAARFLTKYPNLVKSARLHVLSAARAVSTEDNLMLLQEGVLHKGQGDPLIRSENDLAKILVERLLPSAKGQFHMANASGTTTSTAEIWLRSLKGTLPKNILVVTAAPFLRRQHQQILTVIQEKSSSKGVIVDYAGPGIEATLPCIRSMASTHETSLSEREGKKLRLALSQLAQWFHIWATAQKPDKEIMI